MSAGGAEPLGGTLSSSGGGTGGSAGTAGTGGSAGTAGTGGSAACVNGDCCPDDPDKLEAGQCGCNNPDTDSDGDTSADCVDECPDDPNKTEPGECGCGLLDEDAADAVGCIGLVDALVHRYSFAGSSTDVTDGRGSADGVLTGTTLDGSGSVTLDPSQVEQYVSLPGGLVSSLASLTLEAWFVWEGGPEYTRLFDIGSTQEGVEGEPGTGETYVLFTPSGAPDPGYPFAAYNPGDPAQEVYCAADAALMVGQAHHVALAFDPDQGEMRLYLDGIRICADSMSVDLAALDDVNFWLGRSLYAGDPGFAGSIDEFRIYDAALTDEQVELSVDAGPDPLFLEN